MSFRAFTVAAPRAAGSGFGASLSKGRGAFARLLFVLRPSVARELGWAHGDRLEVQIGEDEHHGLVRLRRSEAGTAAVVERQTAHGGWRVRTPAGWRWCCRAGPMRPAPGSSGSSPGQRRCRRRRGCAASPRSLPATPPPHRSALALTRRPPSPQEVITRGEARRRAERREAEEYAAAEATGQEHAADAGDRLAALQTTFGFTPQQARLVQALMGGRVMTREALLAALAGGDHVLERDEKQVDVVLSRARKVLRLHLVEIETVRGLGFRMTPEHIARLLVLIDGGTPGREADERELAGLPDDDEDASEDAA